jgi:hypothetical protein
MIPMKSLNNAAFENDLLPDEQILWTGEPKGFASSLSHNKLTRPFVSKVAYGISNQRVFIYENGQKSITLIETIKAVHINYSVWNGTRFEIVEDPTLGITNIGNNFVEMRRLVDVNTPFDLLMALRAEIEPATLQEQNPIEFAALPEKIYRLPNEAVVWRFSPYISRKTYVWQQSQVVLKLLTLYGTVILGGLLILRPRWFDVSLVLCVGSAALFFGGAWLIDLYRRYPKRDLIDYLITNRRVITRVGASVGVAFIDALQTITRAKQPPNSIDLNTPGLAWLTRLDDPDAVMRLLAELQDKAKRERAG